MLSFYASIYVGFYKYNVIYISAILPFAYWKTFEVEFTN